MPPTHRVDAPEIWTPPTADIRLLPDEPLSKLVTDSARHPELLERLSAEELRQHPELAVVLKIVALRQAADRTLPRGFLEPWVAWWQQNARAKTCPNVGHMIQLAANTAANFPTTPPTTNAAEFLEPRQHAASRIVAAGFTGQPLAALIDQVQQDFDARDADRVYLDAHHTAHAGAEAGKYLTSTGVLQAHANGTTPLLRSTRSRLASLCLQLEQALENRIHTSHPDVGGIAHFYTRAMYRREPHYPHQIGHD